MKRNLTSVLTLTTSSGRKASWTKFGRLRSSVVWRFSLSGE